MIAIRTLDLLSPYEIAEMDEEEFAEEVVASNIGGSHLRKRGEVEEEYKERRDALTKTEELGSFRERKR